MSELFLYIGIFLCVLMILSLYRAIKGPTVLDRLVGVSAVGTKAIALLLIMGFLYERINMFVDLALAYALLNFVAVIALSRYFHKRKGLSKDSLDQ